jgi:hypothetical protein
MLQPMLGAANSKSATTPTTARSLRPDRCDPRRCGIMKLMRTPPRRFWNFPPRLRAHCVKLLGGASLNSLTFGLD